MGASRGARGRLGPGAALAWQIGPAESGGRVTRIQFSAPGDSHPNRIRAEHLIGPIGWLAGSEVGNRKSVTYLVCIIMQTSKQCDGFAKRDHQEPASTWRHGLSC